MTRPQLINKIANAISKMEGYGLLHSVARINNNPGNLRSWSGVPTIKGFAKFPNAEAGWRALFRQVEVNGFGSGPRDSYKLRRNGLTLREFFGGQREEDGSLKVGGYPGYAPSGDNNQPVHYAKFVAKEIGVEDIDAPIPTFVTE